MSARTGSLRTRLPRVEPAALLLLLPTIGLCALAWNHYSFSLDDPYISFRYARNLIEGHGLVFTPGERVEGYSNFLWIIVLVPFMKLGAGPLLVAKLLGLAFALLSLVFVYLTATRLFEGARGRWTGMIAACLVGFSPYYALWAIGGLETTLFALLATVSVYLYVRYAALRWQGLPARDASWMPLALLGMTRPEGPLLFVVILVAKCIDVALRRERPVRVLSWALAFAVVYGAYFGWRWSYYGELLPNTFYAKTGGGWHQRELGLEYLLDFMTTQGLAYLAIAAAGLAGVLVAVVRRRDMVLATLLGIVVAYGGFIVYAGGDWMTGFRFVMHFYPLVALLIAIGLYEVASLAIRAENGTRLRVAPAASLSLVLIVASIFAGGAYIKDDLPWLRDQLGERIDLAPRGPYYEVARYLDEYAPAGSWVALGEAGLIPYYAREINVIDFYGLMDKHIARLPGRLHEKGDADYVLGRAPDYLLLFAAEDTDGVVRYAAPPMRQFFDNLAFERDYRLIYKAERTKLGDWVDYFYLFARQTLVGDDFGASLYDSFDEARKQGLAPRPDVPSGYSIARFEVASEESGYGTGRWGIFALPTTSIAFDVALPVGSRPSFHSAVGAHPVSRAWGSDGFVMRVEVLDGLSVTEVAREEIDASATLVDLDVPLTQYAGRTITLRLSTTNEPGKNGNADWPVWVEPGIVLR